MDKSGVSKELIDMFSKQKINWSSRVYLRLTISKESAYIAACTRDGTEVLFWEIPMDVSKQLEVNQSITIVMPECFSKKLKSVVALGNT